MSQSLRHDIRYEAWKLAKAMNMFTQSITKSVSSSGLCWNTMSDPFYILTWLGLEKVYFTVTHSPPPITNYNLKLSWKVFPLFLLGKQTSTAMWNQLFKISPVCVLQNTVHVNLGVIIAQSARKILFWTKIMKLSIFFVFFCSEF